MKNLLLLIVFLCTLQTSQAQLQYYSSEAATGYTLFEQGGSAYLINNCGEWVNKWNFISPKYHAKLLPNGHLIYIEWVSNKLIERAWDGSIVNELEVMDKTITLDYEVIVLPNDNYLCIARKEWSQAQFDSIGYIDNAAGFPQEVDVVVELDRTTGEVVWLWNTADHVIQDEDPMLPNFGNVKNNPQRLDMAGISPYDWPEEFFMINGMDYNADLDQIVVSLRKAGEIAIIDHSTTLAEAASSSGGNSGKGGDLLYRWGNPKNYDRGTEADQYLFYQHNPNWIQHGEHAGKIIMYNNGLNRPGVSYYERYSTVPIIALPAMSAGGNYALGTDEPYWPLTPNEDYSKITTNHDFYSNYTSAAKVLPNGNILISVGGDSEIFELKPNGAEVWRYHLPGDPFLFRVEKYAPDYPAFIDKELEPMGTLEDPPSTVPCNLNTATKDLEATTDFKIWVNEESNWLQIQPAHLGNYQYSMFDLWGRRILMGSHHGDLQRSLTSLTGGLYIVEITDKKRGKVQTQKIVLK